MSTRCAVCHAVFPSDKGFLRQPIGQGKNRFICPGCVDRKVEAASNVALVFATLMILFGIALGHGPLLYFGSLYLSLVLSVFPHEFGHALAALAVGMRLFQIQIGVVGRIAFVWRIVGLDVVFHSVPHGGCVLCTPKQIRFARLRYAMVLLGGPMGNVLLIVVAQWSFALSSQSDVFSSVFAAIVHGNVFSLAISLFPRRAWIERSRAPTDGLAFLTIPFMSHARIRAWHSTTLYYELLEALQRGEVHEAERWFAKAAEAYPEDWWLLLGRASILSKQRKHREARTVYLEVLGRPEMTPEILAHAWNNIAWTDLMIGDATVREEANRFSEQAIAELPWLSCIKGTRGSVLIELDRVEEGIPFLEQAFRENHEPSDKALNACYLAIAMTKLGDTQKAREYLEEAKRLDPACQLLERAVSQPLETTSEEAAKAE